MQSLDLHIVRHLSVNSSACPSACLLIAEGCVSLSLMFCDVQTETLDEAIELINANENGNGTALFTKSGSAARHFQSEVQARPPNGGQQQHEIGAINRDLGPWCRARLLVARCVVSSVYHSSK